MRDLNNCFTSFSTKTEYDEKIDFRCDAVIIDELNDVSEQKIRQWKEKGYSVHFCVSLSWGNYSDYLNGKWDDKQHIKDIQTDRNGNQILHGPNVPYFVPTMSYIRYLSDKLKPLIDAGLSAVQFQEPDFWFHGGYSEAFKREWGIYYKSPWEPPLSSPAASYKASKLKRFLFARAIFILASDLKDYARGKHRKNFKIYIKTRGLIHNAISGIISPFIEKENAPIDGFFANISPKEKISGKPDYLWAAYAEYNILKGLVRFTRQEVHLAVSPNGDKALISWDEYKTCYESMLTAALLNPTVSGYQVFSKPGNTILRETKKIPEKLFSEILVCAHALTAMKEEKIRWKKTDDNTAGIFVSESMMFQPEYPGENLYQKNFGNDSDALTSLFGMTKPLFANGVSTDFLVLEKIRGEGKILNDYNLLVLSYDFMKNSSPDFHYTLKAWVKSGGILLYIGSGNDIYNTAEEWWQEDTPPYETPESHLFEVLGIIEKVKKLKKKISKLSIHQKNISDSIFEIGKGIVAVLDIHPAHLNNEPAYADFYKRLLFAAAERKGVPFRKNHFYELNRGPYKIIAVTENGLPYTKPGLFVPLFGSALEIRKEISLQSGECGVFYDLDAKKDDDIGIIAIGAKVEDLTSDVNSICFTARLPENSRSLCRLYIPYACDITVNGEPTEFQRDDVTGKTVVFPIEGRTGGLQITASRKRL